MPNLTKRHILTAILSVLILIGLFLTIMTISSSNTTPKITTSSKLSLTLIRTNSSFSGNHLQFKVPKYSQGNNNDANIKLLKLIDSLSPVPKFRISCPIDFGVNYNLTFKTNNHILNRYTFDPGGCEMLKIYINHTVHFRQIPLTVNVFWHDLGMAIGMKNAHLSDFFGTNSYVGTSPLKM